MSALKTRIEERNFVMKNNLFKISPTAERDDPDDEMSPEERHGAYTWPTSNMRILDDDFNSHILKSTDVVVEISSVKLSRKRTMVQVLTRGGVRWIESCNLVSVT